MKTNLNEDQIALLDEKEVEYKAARDKQVEVVQALALDVASCPWKADELAHEAAKLAGISAMYATAFNLKFDLGRLGIEKG